MHNPGAMMQIDWLDDFLTLAKTRNFSLAAEIRNTTQPAFSRRIRRLEDWVGETLIDRSSYPVQLTRAGQSFQAEAETIIEQIASARGRAASAARTERETLLFAATHMISTEFFPAWLQRVSPAAPAAQARLNCYSVARCFDELASGHVDFMLCPIPHAPREEIRAWAQHDHVVVAADRMMPVSVPDGAGGAKFAIRPGALRLPLLQLSESSVLGGAVLRLLAGKAAGAEGLFDTVFESPLKEAVKAMALKGYGVAWLPASSCAAELAEGRLVPAAGEDWMTGYDIRCYRKAGPLSPAAAAFWRKVAATAATA
ncbi:LysR substrate-binding domain-containing protein [Poseidonocella sp. HB161398]|uniref:LysR substrate-binding domain-containing protein n=1 Tax=Poseidonocella sp. HB161398 TaxID=2320855 RepID=UPI001109AD0A|nr:LysR substrate-binding domain-containing protein [Poseidonocella sp. HB161398]